VVEGGFLHHVKRRGNCLGGGNVRGVICPGNMSRLYENDGYLD